jgi:hypothetical protein
MTGAMQGRYALSLILHQQNRRYTKFIITFSPFPCQLSNTESHSNNYIDGIIEDTSKFYSSTVAMSRNEYITGCKSILATTH